MFNACRLKRLRIDENLSQLAMSERLHISQSSYSKYEANKADLSISLLQRIYEEFGVDPSEFILMEKEVNKEPQ